MGVGRTFTWGKRVFALTLLLFLPAASAQAGLLGNLTTTTSALLKPVTTTVTNLTSLSLDGAGEIGPVPVTDAVGTVTTVAGSTVDLLEGQIGIGTLAETVTCPVANLVVGSTAWIQELKTITDPVKIVACALHFLDFKWRTSWTGADGTRHEASVITTVGVPTPLNMDDDPAAEVQATAKVVSINSYTIEFKRIDGGTGSLPGTAELELSDPTGEIFPDEKLAAGVDSRGGRFPDSMALNLTIPGLSLTGMTGDPRFVLTVNSQAQADRAALYARFFSDDAHGENAEPSLVASAGFKPLPATVGADLTMKTSGSVHAEVTTSATTTADVGIETITDPGADQRYARQALGATISALPSNVIVDYEPRSCDGVDRTTLGDGDYECQVIGYEASSVIPRLDLNFDSETIGPGGTEPLIRAEATITELPTELGILVAQEPTTKEQRIQALTPTQNIGSVDARFALNGELVSLRGQRAGLRYESSGETTAIAARVFDIDSFSFRTLGGGFAGDVVLGARQPFDLEFRDASNGIAATGYIEDLPAATHLEMVPGDEQNPMRVNYSGGTDTIGRIGFDIGFDETIAGVIDRLQGTITDLAPNVQVTVNQDDEIYELEATGSTGALQAIGSIDVLARNDLAIAQNLNPPITAGKTGVSAVMRTNGPFALHGRILGLRSASLYLKDQRYVIDATPNPFEATALFDEVREIDGVEQVLERTVTASIDLLPAHIDLSLGIGEETANINYLASDPINELTADLKGERLFEDLPRVNHVAATLRKIPKQLSITLGQQGLLDINVPDGIGSVEALASSGPNPDLPGGGHAAYYEDGENFVAKVRLFGFRRFQMSQDPLSATLETLAPTDPDTGEPATHGLPLYVAGKFDTSDDGVSSNDVTGEVNVSNLPTSANVTYDPDSKIAWTANDEIDSISATGTFIERGLLRTASLAVADIPRVMTLNITNGDDETTYDYTADGRIGSVSAELVGSELYADEPTRSASMPRIGFVRAEVSDISDHLNATVTAEDEITAEALPSTGDPNSTGIGRIAAFASPTKPATLPDLGDTEHVVRADLLTPVGNFLAAQLLDFRSVHFAASESEPESALEVDLATTHSHVLDADAVYYEQEEDDEGNPTGSWLKRTATADVDSVPTELGIEVISAGATTETEADDHAAVIYDADSEIEEISATLEGERLVAGMSAIGYLSAQVDDLPATQPASGQNPAVPALTAVVDNEDGIEVDGPGSIGEINAAAAASLAAVQTLPGTGHAAYAKLTDKGDLTSAAVRYLGFTHAAYDASPLKVELASDGANPLTAQVEITDSDPAALPATDATINASITDLPSSLKLEEEVVGEDGSMLTASSSAEIGEVKVEATGSDLLATTEAMTDEELPELSQKIKLAGALVQDVPTELTVTQPYEGELYFDTPENPDTLGPEALSLVRAYLTDGSAIPFTTDSHQLTYIDDGTDLEMGGQFLDLETVDFAIATQVDPATEAESLKSLDIGVGTTEPHPLTVDARVDVNEDDEDEIAETAALDVTDLPSEFDVSVDTTDTATTVDYTANDTIDSIVAELEGSELYADEPKRTAATPGIGFVRAEMDDVTDHLRAKIDSAGSVDVEAFAPSTGDPGASGIGRIAAYASPTKPATLPDLGDTDHVVRADLLTPAGNFLAAQLLDFRSVHFASSENAPESELDVDLVTSQSHVLDADAVYYEQEEDDEGNPTGSWLKRTATADVDSVPTELGISVTTAGKDSSYVYDASDPIDSIDVTLEGSKLVPGLSQIGYLTAQVSDLPASKPAANGDPAVPAVTAEVRGTDGVIQVDAPSSVGAISAAAAPSAATVKALAGTGHAAYAKLTDNGELTSAAVRYLGFTHAAYDADPFTAELHSHGAHPFAAEAEITDSNPADSTQTAAEIEATVTDLPAELDLTSVPVGTDGSKLTVEGSAPIGSVSVEASGSDLVATANSLAPDLDLDQFSQPIRLAGALVTNVPAKLTLTQPAAGELYFDTPGDGDPATTDALELVRAYLTDGTRIPFGTDAHQLTYVDDGADFEVGGQFLDLESVDFAIANTTDSVTGEESLKSLDVGLDTTAAHPLGVDARLNLNDDGNAATAEVVESATLDVSDLPSSFDVSMVNGATDTTVDYTANDTIDSIVAELEGGDLFSGEPKRSASTPGISYVRAEADDVSDHLTATISTEGAVEATAHPATGDPDGTGIGRVALYASPDKPATLPVLAATKHVVDADLLTASGNFIAAQLLDFSSASFVPAGDTSPLEVDLETTASHVLDADAVYYEQEEDDEGNPTGSWLKRTATADVDSVPTELGIELTSTGTDTEVTADDHTEVLYDADSEIEEISATLEGESLFAGLSAIGYLKAAVSDLPASTPAAGSTPAVPALTATIDNEDGIEVDAPDSVGAISAAAAPSAATVKALAGTGHAAYAKLTDNGELTSAAVRYLGFTHAAYDADPFTAELHSHGAHPFAAEAEITDSNPADSTQTAAEIEATVTDLPAELDLTSVPVGTDGSKLTVEGSAPIGSVSVEASGSDLVATANSLAPDLDLDQFSQPIRLAGALVTNVPAKLTLTQPAAGELYFDTPGDGDPATTDALELVRAYLTDGTRIPFGTDAHQLTYVDDGADFEVGGQFLDLESVDFAIANTTDSVTGEESLKSLDVGLDTTAAHPLGVDARLNLNDDGNAATAEVVESATLDVSDLPSSFDVSMVNGATDTTVDYTANDTIDSIVAELEGGDLFSGEPKRSASTPGISYVRAEADDVSDHLTATISTEGAVEATAHPATGDPDGTGIGRVALYASPDKPATLPVLAATKHVVDADLLTASGNFIAAQLLDFSSASFVPAGDTSPLEVDLETTASHVLDADAVYYEQEEDDEGNPTGSWLKRTATADVDSVPTELGIELTSTGTDTEVTADDHTEVLYDADSEIEEISATLEGESLFAGLSAIGYLKAAVSDLPASTPAAGSTPAVPALTATIDNEDGIEVDAPDSVGAISAAAAPSAATVKALAGTGHAAYAKLTDNGELTSAAVRYLGFTHAAYDADPFTAELDSDKAHPLAASAEITDSTPTDATQTAAVIEAAITDLPSSLKYTQSEGTTSGATGSTMTVTAPGGVGAIDFSATGSDLLTAIEKLTGLALPETEEPIKSLGVRVEGVPETLTLTQPYADAIEFSAAGGIDYVGAFVSSEASDAIDIPAGYHGLDVVDVTGSTYYAAQLLGVESAEFATGTSGVDVELDTTTSYPLTADVERDLTGDGSTELASLDIANVPDLLNVAVDTDSDSTDVIYDASDPIETIDLDLNTLGEELWAAEPRRDDAPPIRYATAHIEGLSDYIDLSVENNGDFDATTTRPDATTAGDIDLIQVAADNTEPDPTYPDNEHFIDAAFMTTGGNELAAQLLDFSSVEYVGGEFMEVELNTSVSYPLGLDAALGLEQDDGSFKHYEGNARIVDVPTRVSLKQQSIEVGEDKFTQYVYEASAPITSLDLTAKSEGLIGDGGPVDTFEASVKDIPEQLLVKIDSDGTYFVSTRDEDVTVTSMTAYLYDSDAGRPDLAGTGHSAYAKLEGGDLGSFEDPDADLDIEELSASLFGLQRFYYEPGGSIELETAESKTLDADFVMTDDGATTVAANLAVSNVPDLITLAQSQVNDALIYKVDNSDTIDTVDIDVTGDNLLGQLGASDAPEIDDIDGTFETIADGVTALSSGDGFSVVTPDDSALVGKVTLAASSTVDSFPALTDNGGHAVSIIDKDDGTFQAKAIVRDISGFTATTDPRDALQTTCSNSACQEQTAQCYEVGEFGDVTYDSVCGASTEEESDVMFLDLATTKQAELDATIEGKFINDDDELATIEIPALPTEMTLQMETSSKTTLTAIPGGGGISETVTTNDIEIFQNAATTDVSATLSGTDLMPDNEGDDLEPFFDNPIKTVSANLTDLPTEMSLTATSEGGIDYSSNGAIDKIEAYLSSGSGPSWQGASNVSHEVQVENSGTKSLAAVRALDVSSFSRDSDDVIGVSLGTSTAHSLIASAKLDLAGDSSAETSANVTMTSLPTSIDFSLDEAGEFAYTANAKITTIQAVLDGFPFEAIPLDGDAAELTGSSTLGPIDNVTATIFSVPKRLTGSFVERDLDGVDGADGVEFGIESPDGDAIGVVNVAVETANPPALPEPDLAFGSNYALGTLQDGEFSTHAAVTNISSVDAILAPELDVSVTSDVLAQFTADVKVLHPDFESNGKYLEGVVEIASGSEDLQITQETDPDSGATTYTTTTDDGIDSIGVDVTNANDYIDLEGIESIETDITGVPERVIIETASDPTEISFEGQNGSGSAAAIDLVEASINGYDESTYETEDHWSTDHASSGYPDWDRGEYGYQYSTDDYFNSYPNDGVDLTWDTSSEDGLLLDHNQDGTFNGAQLVLHDLKSFSYSEDQTDDCDVYEQAKPFQKLSITTTGDGPAFNFFDYPGYSSEFTNDTDEETVQDPCTGVFYESTDKATTYYDNPNAYLAAELEFLPTTLEATLGEDDSIFKIDQSDTPHMYMTGSDYPDLGDLSLEVSDVPTELEICLRDTNAITSMRERLEAMHPDHLTTSEYDSARKLVATAACASQTWTGYTDQDGTQCLGDNNCQPAISAGVRASARTTIDGMMCPTSECIDQSVKFIDLRLPTSLDAWVAASTQETFNHSRSKTFGHFDSNNQAMTGQISYMDKWDKTLSFVELHLAGAWSWDEWQWKLTTDNGVLENETIGGDWTCFSGSETDEYASPITGGDYYQMRLGATAAGIINIEKKLFSCDV